MTIVMVTYLAGTYKLIVSGHADYNPGNDIVCSACSILAYTLKNVLEVYKIEHKARMKEGFIEIEAKGKEVEPYFMMAFVGYKSLEENYPEHVSLTKTWTSIEYRVK